MNLHSTLSGAHFDHLWAVVVAYHPDIPSIKQLCMQLQLSGARVVVVDNTETPMLKTAYLPTGSKLHSLHANTGIAHAQNVGITSALTEGARIIVFFDQDSTFEVDFISQLVSKLRLGMPDVVAPRCLDVETQVVLPSQRLLSSGMARPIYRNADLEPFPVDIVISSGTAVTREAIEHVGLMDEDLFIDFVDTEWCLRCRSKQVSIRVVPTAVMLHRIGSRSVSEAGLTITIHSPLRCYYQIRNSLHLFRRDHIPRIFAAKELLSVLINRLLLLRHVRYRGSYLKAYAQGLRDGILGRVGPRETQ